MKSKIKKQPAIKIGGQAPKPTAPQEQEINEILELIKVSAFEHTAIATYAQIGYPRFRRIVRRDVQPTKWEIKNIMSAITVIRSEKLRHLESIAVHNN